MVLKECFDDEKTFSTTMLSSVLCSRLSKYVPTYGLIAAPLISAFEDMEIEIGLKNISAAYFYFSAVNKRIHNQKMSSWLRTALIHLYYNTLIKTLKVLYACLLYTSPSPRDLSTSRMPSSA
eukprot:TRINITY_DN53655_c0_g1_i1.p1 TRINITY_DN53655_c0_g1~~TRINITY_DN53655_c0_g1_i1.p1  ORF type:complete len:131 (-),score=22.72 TRINITY_DN53655_c0_g1_i1:108-473(-)